MAPAAAELRKVPPELRPLQPALREGQRVAVGLRNVNLSGMHGAHLSLELAAVAGRVIAV